MTTTSSPIEAEAAVARGIALLDERVEGWRDRIDVARLDLHDCRNCVLGQLFGEYVDGLSALGLDSGLRHGFACAGWLWPCTCDALTKVWLRTLSPTSEVSDRDDEA